MINGHGNNLYHFERGKIKYDFSSNIAYNNKSGLIISYLKDVLDSVKNYPDPGAISLTYKIAVRHKIKAGNVLVVNGSAEAFYLVAHLLGILAGNAGNRECNTLIFTPSFAEYEDSCKLYNHKLTFRDISLFTDTDLTRFDSLWLGTPNNPDGYRTKYHDILQKCKNSPDCRFVVDMAYNQLSDSEEETVNIAGNLILINSLTKSFGIPGLRLGYIIAAESIIDRLSQMRPPWSVNSAALMAGGYVMDNYDTLLFDKKELIEESLFLQKEISGISSFSVTGSGCNFFLCSINDCRNASDLQKYLIEKHGILIRDASNFRGLTPRHFRIAAQTREANIHLIDALKKWK